MVFQCSFCATEVNNICSLKTNAKAFINRKTLLRDIRAKNPVY
jgi:hypothetical protein